MRNRRTFIGLFLLVSMLFLGVGYAALTNSFSVSGSVNAEENHENLKVQFTSSYSTAAKEDEAGTDSSLFTVKLLNESSLPGRTAEIEVNGISKIGQNAVIVLQLQNNSSNVESLTAKVDNKFDIKLGTDLEDPEYSTNGDCIVTGEHFKVEVRYFDVPEGVSVTKDGDVITDVVLKPGEFVYVEVKITLIDAVQVAEDEDGFPVHHFSVTFDANTVELE